jgi:hypothetical protein
MARATTNQGESKMKKMTLTNNFHNTEMTIMVPEHVETQQEAWDWVQYEEMKEYTPGEPVSTGPFYRKRRRIENTLCTGDSCCSCGTVR